MSISLSQEAKNTLSLSNESKIAAATWEDMDIAWEDATFSWDQATFIIGTENKNNLTLTNEIKN